MRWDKGITRMKGKETMALCVWTANQEKFYLI